MAENSDIPNLTEGVNNPNPSNAHIIVDSTRTGFISNYQNPRQKEKPLQEVTPPKSGEEQLKDTFKETLAEKITPSQEKEAMKMFTGLMKSNMKPFKVTDFLGHNMIFFRYNAKDQEKTFDKTPLILVLNRSSSYTLGLNLHWCPTVLRLTLLKIIIKLNKANIAKGLPLNVTYEMIKPLIFKLNLGPVIRLYINDRMSKRGLVVPPEMWLIAARMRAESFNSGASAEAVYKKAVAAFKISKQNAIRKGKKIYK